MSEPALNDSGIPETKGRRRLRVARCILSRSPSARLVNGMIGVEDSFAGAVAEDRFD